MIKNLSIFWQFVTLSIMIFVVIGIFLASLVAPTLTKFVLEQQKLNVVVFSNRLAADHLLAADFRQPATGASGERFERFAGHLQIPGLFRVKIWNPEGTIVYSDKRELVGQRFLPDSQFEKVLKLETIVDLMEFKTNDPRYFYEMSFREGMRVLAPITFGASPEVVGVIETFSRIGFLKQQINDIKNSFTYRTFFSLVLMFMALSLVVWRASKTVQRQQDRLQEYATGLEKMVAERTRQLEESTQKQLKHADEILRLKDEFVSLASHQLRTPPTTVSWYAEILLSEKLGPINDQQKKYLTEIYNANQRMTELVNSFLNISRIEMGTFPINPKPTNLVETIETILTELSALINERKLIIERHYAKDLPMINVDPQLVDIIFQNLLSNAAKYTPPGGKIDISLEMRSADILITVSDNGYGIPADQQSGIFTKLFRADNVRDKDSNGTGLGLYLTKAVVSTMGGKISFKSEENKGTTFYVTIPFNDRKQSAK